MKKYFLSGLLLWLPIWAVFVVLRVLVNVLDQSTSLIPPAYRPENLIGFHVPGLGIILTLIIILLTGVFATNFIGKHLVRLGETIINRLPIIRSIYSAVQKLMHAFISDEDSFRKVLLVEYPKKGIWSMGFQTYHTLAANPTDEDLVSVFIPTTPNPTSGFLIFPKRSEVKEMDISVEEAFKLIVSLGVVHPKEIET